MIIVSNLSKSYNSQLILDNINLTINKGEIIGIIGPSGSGKSTFLRCINNLETPDSGNIKIDNVDSTDQSIYKKIGMVFQHFNLFPHMRVLENLTYAPIKVLKKNKQAVTQQAYALLNKINLSEKAQDFPNNLSGGQKQRIAIIRTLMMSPTIILFDEPTSALDHEIIKDILDLIKSLVNKEITLLIVTHELNFIKEVANRILFFDQGRIIEDNVPKGFFTSPSTKRAKQFLASIIN